MCLNETYSRIQVGKHLSDMLPITNGLKQGDALTPLLFNFAYEYANRRVQVNQDGLKLNYTHQLLVYADEFNILGRSVRTVKENTEASAVANKETRLEVIADKTKYMVMSPEQNAGRSQIQKLKINPLQGWNSSKMCEQLFISKFNSGRN